MSDIVKGMYHYASRPQENSTAPVRLLRSGAILCEVIAAAELLSAAHCPLSGPSGTIRLIDGIGSTEMIHIFIGAAGDDIRPGATGRVLPGYQACVLDDENRPLPRGSVGRL